MCYVGYRTRGSLWETQVYITRNLQKEAVLSKTKLSLHLLYVFHSEIIPTDWLFVTLHLENFFASRKLSISEYLKKKTLKLSLVNIPQLLNFPQVLNFHISVCSVDFFLCIFTAKAFHILLLNSSLPCTMLSPLMV